MSLSSSAISQRMWCCAWQLQLWSPQQRPCWRIWSSDGAGCSPAGCTPLTLRTWYVSYSVIMLPRLSFRIVGRDSQQLHALLMVTWQCSLHLSLLHSKCKMWHSLLLVAAMQLLGFSMTALSAGGNVPFATKFVMTGWSDYQHVLQQYKTSFQASLPRWQSLVLI